MWTVICYCNAPSCISSNYMCKSEKECYSQIVYKSLQDFLLNRKANHLYGCVEGMDFTAHQPSTDVAAASVNREDWYTLNYFCSSDLCNTLKGSSQVHSKPTAHKLSEPIAVTATFDASDFIVPEQDSTSTVQPPPSYPDQSVLSDFEAENSEGLSSSVNVTPATALTSPWRLRILVIILAMVGIVMIAGLVYMARLILNKDSLNYHGMANKKVANSCEGQSFYVTISSQNNLLADGDGQNYQPCAAEQILVLKGKEGDDCTKYLLFPVREFANGL